MSLGLGLQILVPLHISGVWVPQYSDNLLESGSRGAGLAVATHLRANTTPECRIVLNDKEVLYSHAQDICKILGVKVGISAKTPFNLGSGFGISAALTIAHSIAANTLCDGSILKALQLAHSIEVKYSTGLGDVIAEYLGGFVIRVKAGAPGVGIAYRIPIKTPTVIVLGEVGNGEPTQSLLSRMSKEVITEGEKLLNKIWEHQDLQTFFDCAKAFTSRLFNYNRVERLLEGVRGVSGYYLKKSALVMWIEREFVNEVVSRLLSKGLRIYPTTLSPTGVQVVDTP